MSDQEPLERWDPSSALASLAQESAAFDETEEQQAHRIFRENLPVAAAAICHTARYSGNERVRLDAARYVVERNLGRLQDVQASTALDPFEQLMADVVKDFGS